ncbi:MAG: ferrous iron transport protein B [Porcipelethomonas sp.]
MSAKIALAGNPNCGKTTLFNALTGSRQHVGNWAGVTVEKKSGTIRNTSFTLIDLPGVYSLDAFSTDEKITVDYLLGSRPDALINIIDGMHLERNLFLTLKLAELEIPMIAAVNMMDEVNLSGMKIDFDLLYEMTGIPFIPVSARSGENIDKITEKLKDIINRKPGFKIRYENSIQNALNCIYDTIYDPVRKLPYAFYASEILSGKNSISEKLHLTAVQNRKIKFTVDRLRSEYPQKNTESIAADAVYSYIDKLIRSAVTLKKADTRDMISHKADRILLGKFTAFPIFFCVMLAVFFITFGPPGSFLCSLMETFINKITAPSILGLMTAADAPDWTVRLISEGIIGGVGSVLRFLPQIALFFLFLSFLEDSGYMARAAFLTDKFMRKTGLSGKSFIPMLMGFGCTTTAVMSARTQENSHERKMTIMLTPFMSCSAKLPVYALFTGVFFPEHSGLVIFILYITGLVIAAVWGLILRKTLFKDKSSGFIMELPPYRLPLLSNILKETIEKTKGFVLKAGTLIFAMSVAIWLFQNISSDLTFADSEAESIFSQIGKFIFPVFAPLGFPDWKTAVSLLSGIVAKEAVISSMGVLYGSGLYEILPQIFTPLSAVSFMLFVLLYNPCISAIAAIKRETGSAKWALLSAFIHLATAYTVSLIVYRTGNYFLNHRFDMSILVALICGLIVFSGIYLLFRNVRSRINGSCCGNCIKCEHNCHSGHRH